MQDVIERSIKVRATKERVYAAITDPKEITKWFPDEVEAGTLEVGQSPIFFFKGENHRAQIYVEAARPFDYFAYRWVPGMPGMVGDVLSVPNTLVEFFIASSDDGTLVTVKESGFAALPTELAKISFEQNSGGWGYMMDRLEKVMSQ